jgi:hypothetical protein
MTRQWAAFHGASANPASLPTTFFSACGCPRIANMKKLQKSIDIIKGMWYNIIVSTQ